MFVIIYKFTNANTFYYQNTTSLSLNLMYKQLIQINHKISLVLRKVGKIFFQIKNTSKIFQARENF